MSNTQTYLSETKENPEELVLKMAARKRKNMFSFFFGILVIVGLTAGSYWYFVSSHYISTNDAYVAAEVAQVTPSIDGIVKTINVVDTQSVKAGDVLVIIDETDAKLALVRATGILAKAQTDVERGEIDLKRRKALAVSGSISGEELSNAENAYHEAKAIYDTAKAAVDQADIDLGRTIIKAPTTGVVAQREVQLGQKVRAGTLLMSIIPLKNVYVNANFKENQLSKVKPGQSVELVSDLHGSNIIFHGCVEGLSGGTGAVFSLIPAQNATGNWIKVVQRLPVRIALNAKELMQNPLQIGLSMVATIDVSVH